MSPLVLKGLISDHGTTHLTGAPEPPVLKQKKQEHTLFMLKVSDRE